MNNKKHIFFDMDGTLLNSEHKILDENILEIKKLQQEGVGISLATGRSITMVMKYIKQLNVLDPCVLANGNFIYYPNANKIKVIGKNLNSKVKEFFINYLKEYGGTITWFDETKDYIYSTTNGKNTILEYTNNIYDLSNLSLNDLENLLLSNNVYHLTIMLDKENDSPHKTIESLTLYFKELEKLGLCKITNTSNIFIDADNLYIDKCNTIKYLINEIKIQEQNVYVFGDSNNDFNMIKYFKNSFAMGNALKKVKDVASNVIGSNNVPSIACVLQNFFKK